LIGDLDSHSIIPAFEKQVHRSIIAAEALDPQLGDPLWQIRRIKHNPIVGALYGSSQARLNQQKHCSRRPSLRRTGDRIERRTFTTTPLESAEQFREASKIRPSTGVEKAQQDSAGQVLAAVFR
jgi:hypothetical protein